MKRKILMLLCLLLATVIALASCVALPQGEDQTKDEGTTGGEPTDGCTHTFSDQWSSSATEHWHAATCEHGEVKDSLAAHTDSDEDGKCDVCAYEIGHTHTYAKDWSSDGSYHWHAATCTHTDEKRDNALHTDANIDGECDVCEAHVHIVDTTGYCTVCGNKVNDIDETDIEKLIAAILASSKNVLSGKVEYDVVIRDQESELTQWHDLEYLFATNGIYTKRTEDEIAVEGEGFGATASATGNRLLTENWMRLDAEDSVYAITVQKLLDQVIYAEPIAVGTDDLIGYYFAVSTLANEYGAENTLSALYELSQTEHVTEYTVKMDAENNKVTLSYNILVINEDTAEGEDDGVDYYEVEVSFGYSDKYVLTSLDIKCDCYTNSLADEAEHDYTYDQETKTITMKDTATADTYTFKVTQTEGTRAELNMEAVEPFIPDEVIIYEDEEKTMVAETLTIRVEDVMIELYTGCAPAGSYINFIKNQIEITVTNKADGSAANGLSAMLVGEVIQVFPVVAGEYVIMLTYGESTKTVNITVEADEVEGSNTIEITADDNNTWVGPYDFTATESGSYTFVLPNGFSAWNAEDYINAPYTSSPEVDWSDPTRVEDGTFTVAIAAGETFSFYYRATAKNVPYTIAYTFVAHDVEVGGGDDDDDIVGTPLNANGNNAINAADVTWTFTAASAGNLKLTLSNAIMGDVAVSYTVNGGDVTEFALGSEATLTLNAGETVVITVVAQGYATLTAEWSGEEGGDGDEVVTVVAGTYTGTDGFGNAFLTVIVTEADVTFAFNHPMMGPSSIVATYEIVDGEVVLYDENGTELNPLAGALAIDENGTPVSADYNGTTYTLAVAGGDGEGEGDDDTNEPDGSMDNPYIIESFPFEINMSGYHDVFYKWTATEDCTLLITRPAGVYVSITANDYETDYENLSYTVYVTKDEEIILNPWGGNEGDTETPYAYSITKGEPVIEGSFDKPISLSTWASNSCEYA
ncbi:MAG: hypothetical protein IJX80_10420, partial [Clostridia bacterium]|nr:hypothetical protein [Clostridia bacterium]